VAWDRNRKKWIAQTTALGKNVFLGRFSDELQAARAYDEYAKRTYGDFTQLNFP
jgi:hypothetical protein